MKRLLALALAQAFIGSACGLLPKATPNPGVPCEQVYDEGTCVALRDLATTQVRKQSGEIIALAILPEPSPPAGSTSGAATPIRVRLTMKDGSSKEAALCGGVSMEPVCSAQPRASPG